MLVGVALASKAMELPFVATRKPARATIMIMAMLAAQTQMGARRRGGGSVSVSGAGPVGNSGRDLRTRVLFAPRSPGFGVGI